MKKTISKTKRQSNKARRAPNRTTKSALAKVAAAIRRMKKGSTSLSQAARKIGVSPRTVVRHAGSVLQKSKSGRYKAKPSDRLTRELLVPTPSGPQEIALRNSREASRLGTYWAALHKYFENGDASDLKQFTGQFITDVNRKKHTLITDLEILNRLGSAGAVSFESIYSWSAQ